MLEKGESTRAESMKGVPRSLPAAMRAAKVIKRVNEACRVKESAAEAVKAAAEAVSAMADAKDAEKQLGEAMLMLVAAARAVGADPELSLNAATDRMIARFEKMENEMLAQGGSFEEISQENLRKYWNLVKLSD